MMPVLPGCCELHRRRANPLTHKGQDSRGSAPASNRLLHEELTYAVIGAFFAVYHALGHGFLESVYRNALVIEHQRRGLSVRWEVPVEVTFLGQPVGTYRMDLVVEGKILIEIKAGPVVGETERRQVSNYLRASKLTIALLLHFGPRPWHKRFVASKSAGDILCSV